MSLCTSTLKSTENICSYCLPQTLQSSSESSADDIDEQLEQLTEMFPDTLRLELTHCIQGAKGDLEQAVQLVLHRQETGVAITEDKKVGTVGS